MNSIHWTKLNYSDKRLYDVVEKLKIAGDLLASLTRGGHPWYSCFSSLYGMLCQYDWKDFSFYPLLNLTDSNTRHCECACTRLCGSWAEKLYRVDKQKLGTIKAE